MAVSQNTHNLFKHIIRDDHIHELRKIYGLDDEAELNKTLETIENWVAKQNHFVEKEIDRRYIEFMLIQCKGSIEKTKKRLDRFFTLRTMIPEILQNFDLKNEFKDIQKSVYHCAVPQPTEDFYAIIVGKIHNDESFNLLQYVRYMVVGCEYYMHNHYIQGYIGVFDLDAISFGLVNKLNPIVLQKFLVALKDCYNGRVKAIHVVNPSKFTDTVISILKQVMTDKMASRVHVHSNYDSLHKHVPKELLPSEYGGDAKSILELQEDTFKAFTSDGQAEVMKRNEKYRTNESLRLTSNFNEEYMGTPGSFRMLSVD